MPLYPNFVPASELEARAADFTRRFDPAGDLEPCISTLAENFDSVASGTFGEANRNFSNIFKVLELLEARVQKKQAGKDPFKKWLSDNGKATAEEFGRFLAEKSWGSPPQYAALERLLELGGKAFYAKFEEDKREKVPRCIFFHRRARLHCGV